MKKKIMIGYFYFEQVPQVAFRGVGKLVYDINLNYLGVRSQESGVRRKETRRNRRKS